ncbi:DUF4031 domain-containing protein [Rhodobacter sp. NSM]|uniref:DUF4031 domain-containing protein n=1 Tax=Rhodobacter sp. NSM TaxID=3457501 RepID=UPI003FD0E26D
MSQTIITAPMTVTVSAAEGSERRPVLPVLRGRFGRAGGGAEGSEGADRMTVYVDDMHRHPIGRLGRMRMSHMIADSTAELLEMADRIGLDRRHLQHAGTAREHFDICLSRRACAVVAGAVEITMRDMARRRHERGHGS